MSSKETKLATNEQRHFIDGEYLLTYAQIFALNKKLPKGIKIELEENLSKPESTIKQQPQIKRPRSSNIIKDFSEEEEESVKKKKIKKQDHDSLSKDDSSISNNNSTFKNNKRLREKKHNNTLKVDLDVKDIETKNKASTNIEVSKKCEKIFNKLKKHPLCDYFLNQDNTQFSLNSIERNLKNCSYVSYYQFGMDIRKIWNHYFPKSTINSDIYQKTFTLSNYFEEIFKDIENNTEEKSDIHELHKKVNKLQEKFNTLNNNKSAAPNNTTKRERSYSNSEKPMSISEKNQLGNSIRLLNADQLKGILKILSESLTVDQSSKYFEFDIETLPPKKLRELDKYVKNCLKLKNTQNANQATSNNPIATNKEIQRKNTNITNNNGSTSIKHSNNPDNNTIKRPSKKPYIEDSPRNYESKNNDVKLESKFEEDRNNEYTNESKLDNLQNNNVKFNNTNSTIHTSSENKNKQEIVQEETKDSNKKEDKSRSDSGSSSNSDSDSESLSELDFTKKTNKVI